MEKYKTLNYIGCKTTLIPKIRKVIDTIPNLKDLSFLDLFAGTGVVSYNFQSIFNKTYANDLELYSYVINYALLKCPYSDHLEGLINELSLLNGISSLITKYYSEERLFFTAENAMKCDAIRTRINELYKEKEISKKEYHFLLASLITSIDQVANTASVYGAYLKQFKKSALNSLKLIPIHKVVELKDNKVYQQKAEELVQNIEADVVYMDPPYNHRQYAGNYSFLNYLCLYDKSIIPKGKSGLLPDYNKSDFCKKTTVKASFTKLIKDIRCKYLLLSYNNEGLVSYDFLKEVLMEKGKVKLYKIPYSKFNSHKQSEKETVYEYLWFVQVGNDSNFEDNYNL